MALFGFDLTGILSAIRGFLGPFGKLFDAIKKSYDQLVGIFDSAEKLTNSVVAEVDAWKNFKQDIRIKQRVVQVERAIEKTRDLIAGIPAAWRAIVDLVKNLREQVQGGESPLEETQSAVEDIESGGGLKALLEKFPKLARGLEKLLGVFALIIQALEAIARAIDDIQTIVDEIKAIRLEIEKLDTIFLPQSNKRKTLKLADGSSIKIRVGKLHPS